MNDGLFLTTTISAQFNSYTNGAIFFKFWMCDLEKKNNNNKKTNSKHKIMRSIFLPV